MNEQEREFIKEMKILLTKFEYAEASDADGKMDLVDEIFYTARGFKNQYCE